MIVTSAILSEELSLKRAAMLQNICLSTNLGNRRLGQTHQRATILARRRSIADSGLNTWPDSRILADHRGRLASNPCRDTTSQEPETPNQSECRIYILAQMTAFHGLVYLYRLNVCGVRIACHPDEYLAMYQWIREGRHIPTMRMVGYQGETYTMTIVCARLPSPMPTERLVGLSSQANK